MTHAPDLLQPLPYHRRVADYLEAHEPSVWSWFSSDRARTEFADRIRLDLLKSAYRLERDTHADAYRLAEEAAGRLGISAPLTLYQSQQGAGMNAAVCWLPGEAHLLLTGPVLSVLSPNEARAVFAHELGHFLLWEMDGRALFTADQVLGALARHPEAEPSHTRTAQLWSLYTEVFADRAALHAVGDPLVAISALVKIETGLAEVSAESYLRQADEIFAKEDPHAAGTSHPETFIRARAVRLWAEQPDRAAAEVERMLEGPSRLDALDLPGQARLEGATRRLLRRLLSPPELRTEGMLAHARMFFDGFEPADPQDPDPGLREALHFEDPALRDYVCWVLLDFAAADPTLEDAPLVAAFAIAEPLGLGDRLAELAHKELKKKKKTLEQARKEGAAAGRGSAAAGAPAPDGADGGEGNAKEAEPEEAAGP